MPLLSSPVLSVPPPEMESCEHCLTVTWAGVPACGCEFGILSVDEEAVRRIYRLRKADDE